MICNKCGNQIPDNSTVCNYCGNPQQINNFPPPVNVNYNNPQPANNKGFEKTAKIIVLSMMGVVVLLLTILLVRKPGDLVYSGDENTRTIMIYMVGSNLETDSGIATSDIDSINVDEIDFDAVNVLLYTGGTEIWHNFVQNDENAIYELTPDGFEKVESYKQLNMGSPDTLSDFLNYAYDNYHTDKYDLILYNHGAAILGAIFDDISSDNLSLADFSEALEDSRFDEDNKLEMVIFRTCLNGTLEVASTFAPYAEYLVASEEVTRGNADSRAFEFINTITVEDSSIDFGTKFIDSYVDWMNDVDPLGTLVLTYSLIDLSMIDDINSSLDDFTDSININKDYNLVSKVRSNLYQYANDATLDYDTVDLYNLIEGLEQIDTYKANTLLDLIDEAVIYKQVNDDSHGLAIYMPYNGADQYKTYFLNNIYQQLDMLPKYYKFINDFNNTKKTGKTSSFDTFSVVNTNVDHDTNEFSIQLTEEQASTFAKASYVVFKKVPEGFIPIYKSNDYNLDENGLLSTKLEKNMIKIKDTESGEEDYIFAVKIDDDEYNTYTTLQFLDNTAGIGLDYELFSATTTIKLDKNGKPFVASHAYYDSKQNGVTSTILDEEDFTVVVYWLPTYNILDENGNYIPDFESAGVYYGLEVHPGKYELSRAEMDDGEYYCVFMVYDIYNNQYYSNLTKLN